MKCDICHKNDATIHIQEITDGKNQKLDLCVSCATEKKLASFGMEPIDLSEILNSLSKDMKALKQEGGLGINDLPFDMHHSDITFLDKVCLCGWTGMNVKKTGRLGCSECYNVFRVFLDNALKSMHRNTVHIGKRPEKLDINKNERLARIAVLQKELELCVQNEKYEKAAHLRDEINDLKAIS